MKLPSWPLPRQLEAISPTLYNAVLACSARALWSAAGSRGAFPDAPAALLGTAFHAVTEAAAKGALRGSDSERYKMACDLFADTAMSSFAAAHPLTRWRYGTPEHLPFFSLLQAEAAENAVRMASLGSGHSASQRRAERTLRSRDNLILGRIDLIDSAREEVVDYKTGLSAPGANGIQVYEARQLRLYAYLCSENGITIRQGVIIRRDGKREEMPISPEDANREAALAKEARERFNQEASEATSGDTLASPSEENCQFCSCRPMCEPYWQTVSPAWAAHGPVSVEGAVISERRLGSGAFGTFSLTVQATRGTVAPGVYATDALPVVLSEADGSPPVAIGDTVRIVDAQGGNGVTPLRARNRGLTTIWTAP